MAKGRSKQNRKSPFLRGLLPLDKKAFPSEVIAGLTLAAIAIPEVMGYTRIAGTPVVTGIYTILFPVIIFALFGASRHLVIGADSATAAILAHAIIPLAAIGSPEYLSYVYLLSIMVGVLLLVCRLLRLGFIGKFLSRTVLAGFLTGVGVLVALGQVGGMLGIHATGDGMLAEFGGALTQLPQTNLYAALVAGATLAIIAVPGLLGKKFTWLKKNPVASCCARYLNYRRILADSRGRQPAVRWEYSGRIAASCDPRRIYGQDHVPAPRRPDDRSGYHYAKRRHRL